jgi:hypothetical protein
LVERLTGEGVNKVDPSAVTLGLQQMRLDRLLDGRQQRLVAEVGHRRPEVERNFLSDHCGYRQRMANVLTEMSHPALDDLAKK